MSEYGKLPADFAIDALTAEVERRKTKGDYRCSYGKLVAATTREQREGIAEQYRKNFRKHKRGGTRTAFLETQKEILADALRAAEETAGE
jgi:hypothetical protein